MSLKYITSNKTGVGELEGGSIWGRPHNFISLVAPKGHNPALVIPFMNIHDIQGWQFENRMNNYRRNFTFSCGKNVLKVASLALLETHS